MISCKRTEEDTTEGGERAEQVGLPGDRSLSEVHVGGGLNGTGLDVLLDIVVSVFVVHGDGRTR